jgi:hypothetical protein
MVVFQKVILSVLLKNKTNHKLYYLDRVDFSRTRYVTLSKIKITI